MKFRAWYQKICEPSERAKNFGVIHLRLAQTLSVEANDMAGALSKIAEIFEKEQIDAEVIKIRVFPKSQLGDR